MIRSYIKIALRNISKRKLYSFINAFGLSIGIAFCILIYLFIHDERSFDQFHANKDIIYRVHCTSFQEESEESGASQVARAQAVEAGEPGTSCGLCARVRLGACRPGFTGLAGKRKRAL